MTFLRSIKQYSQLILVVFLAFFVMVATSYFFAQKIVLKKNAEISCKVISNAENAIKAYFADSQAILLNVVFGVEDALGKGTAKKELQNLFIKWNWWLKERNEISFFNGIFGTVNGEYFDSTTYKPHNELTPESRPWYIGAVNSNKLYFSSPYTNALTGNLVISISTSVRHKDAFCGVLAVDVHAHKIIKYVEEMNIAGYGYGMLLDHTGNIIAHPDHSLTGKNIYSINPKSRKIGRALADGQEVNAVELVTYKGEDSIVFFRPLYNGWYIGVVTSKTAYNRDIYNVAAGLGIIGLFMMILLSYLLIKMEKARKRSEAESLSKSNFLATMSHEIRTPMNAIIGMSELVLRDNITPMVREHMVGIKHAGDYLLSLINDILDFSKIESGKLEIVETSYVFTSTINDVIDIIRMKVSEKPIDFVVYIASSIPSELVGDESRVRQIMLNVLNNAVKYTQEGFISLSVGIDVSEQTALLKIAVADSGIGIKEKDQEKLFDDFVRIDNEKTRGVEGTGLGLAITKKLSKAMGGDISLKSEYGKGSVFSITIPQKIAGNTPIAKVENADECRVLLYGPDNIYAVSIKKALRDLGVKYRFASNQTKLKESLLSGRYDFVFVYSFVMATAKSLILESGVSITMVVVADFGEPLVGQEYKLLTLPGYCVPIANILNGGDGFTSNSDHSFKYFIAPQAKILIVDDIKTNITVAQGLLAPYSMQLDIAESGPEAIEKVKNEHYDIVFMDHMMPVMDGIEATQEIRSLENGNGYYASLPIIALSANATTGAKSLFLQNGMNDFVQKPVDIVKLNSILEKWMPAEKIQQYISENIDDPLPELTIEGIDILRGLQITGGSVAGYFNILSVFLRDGTKQISLLEKFYTSKNLSLYENSVHALKSACASIGGTKISEMAKALEYAAKNENMSFIDKYHEDFIKNLHVLLNNISAVLLNKLDAFETEDLKGNTTDNYQELLHHIEEMDMTSIDRILSKLQSEARNFDNWAFIDALTEDILLSNFDEAIYKLKTVLNGNKRIDSK